MAADDKSEKKDAAEEPKVEVDKLGAEKAAGHNAAALAALAKVGRAVKAAMEDLPEDGGNEHDDVKGIRSTLNGFKDTIHAETEWLQRPR